MDKDLRDAYKALSLVRADLDATRKAKADADAKWRAFATQQQQENEQLRESLAMREEELHSQRTPRKTPEDPETPESPETPAGKEPEHEHGDDKPDAPDNANPSLEDVAKDQIALLTSVYELKTKIQEQAALLVAQDAQFAQDRSEWSLLSEAMKRQLAELQESQLDLVREKKFMDEKFEFVSAEVDVVKRERDALQLQLKSVATPAISEDMENSLSTGDQTENAVSTGHMEIKQKELQDEMQRLKDQHAEREASLMQANESLQRELNQMRTKHSQDQQDREKQFEQEQATWTAEKQKLTRQVDESSEMMTGFADQKHQLEQLQIELAGKQTEIDGLLTDRTELIQQLQQIRDHSTEQLHAHTQQEEERMLTQRSEQEKLQHELTTLLASFEAATSENAVKMSGLQCSNDALQRALVDKSRELDEAQALASKEHRQLKTVADHYRDGLTSCRHELQTQRALVVEYQNQLKSEVGEIHEALVSRFEKEMKAARGQLTEIEKQLAASEVERLRVDKELEHAQNAARVLREQLKAVDRDAETMEQLQVTLAAHESHLQHLEQQLMVAEDLHTPTASTLSWLELASAIRTLDDFLPQLQLFAGRLQTSFQLCAENVRAMDMLSRSASASPTLRSDLSSLLQLAQHWQQRLQSQSLPTHVKLVRRSVLATLSQWFEETDQASGAPPPFAIDSQEVAIVLENWTSDTDKQAYVSEWLQEIATTTSLGEQDDQDPNQHQNQNQSTLELQQLTREVKDAFCMLIVPLLRQNHSVSVRVFTRRVCDIKRSYSPDETSWEMRLYVHGASPSSGALRRIPSTSSVSSLGSSASSVASSLSLSSIKSASKLQMIQARLQQMQQQPPHAA